MLLLAATSGPRAGTVTVFGPQILTRTTGAPNVFDFTFAAKNPSLPYTLRIDNDGVASAVITVNGAVVLGPSEFNPGIALIQRAIPLRPSNTLRVELRSKPGSRLTIRILGTDNQPPTITATATPAANAAAWNRTDVQVQFVCSDAETGIATCAPARIVTTEGAGQVITGSATDQAGNTATASTTLNIDKTAPAISGSVQPPPGAAGWINQNATVTFTCADDRSGIASCAPPVIVSAGGGNQIVSGAAIDRAGNTAAASLTVNIDQAPPTITAVVSPLPNAAGWNSSDVTVTFMCADAISGVAACPAPAIVSTEGANQTISGTARDQAGNVATTSVTVSVDKTAATITAAASPAPNADGWNSSAVVVSFACGDAGAGVLSCPEPATISGDGANQTVSRTVTDKAGNVATASVALNIDTSLPTITATPLPPANAQGWNDANVLVTFTCADAVSGIQVCPAPMQVPTEGPSQVVTGTAIDKAGNRASASVTLNIDKTAVSITAAVQPPPNAAGWNSTAVVVTFVCEDGGSGAVACPAPVAVTAEGANQIISRTVTDAAGNRSTASISVSIDKTAPLVTSALAPSENSAGWVREDATITFTCVDPGGSGIASCTPPATLGEGAAQPISASAVDIAGNTATLTVAVSVDTTAPAIAASITPAPNAGGWVGSDATIVFVCGDTLSGIASCPAPIPVTAEGPQTFTGAALDRAGNEATTSVSINVDKTRATITAAVQPAPNAAGWNSTDVIVTFTCQDTGAGVASCPPAVPVTAEGANQEISGAVTDLAGNQSEVAISVSIDKTPPQASATLSPGPNAAGWVDRATTVTFACADPGGSGVASCPPPVVVQEGAAQPIGGTAIDLAGNTATAALIVSVDAAPPTILATVTPPPNAAGWLQADATVTFTCADAGSGIESCPAPVHVAAQGAGQIVTGAAVDRAGNRSTATVTLNVDSTPAPITAVVTPAANGSGWHSTDVIVTFICGEDGSGVVSCPPPVTVSTEGADQVVTRSVVDLAGNTSQASVTLNIDKTPPAIGAAAAPAPNGAAWNRTDVTVSFVCSDSLSTVGSCPQPVTISSEGAGQNVSGAAQDLAGNTATASLLLNIDTTAPVVAITSPLSGATTLVSPVALGGTAVDALSGIAAATCNGAPAPGAGGVLNCAPALASGLNTLTLTATDVAGNVATSQVNVTFLPNRSPVANAGGAYSGLVGSPVSFSGSGSTDQDNDPLTYAWSFGDGATGAGVTPSHVYASAGTFNVLLTVTDTSGATSSAATSAAIAQPNRTPTATANGPYAGLTGVAVAFNGQGFDPDGTALTYSWSFGDGLTASGAAVSHSYSAANTYTATLTVSDGQLSAVSTASVQIAQSNRAPTATAGGPRTGETGIAVSFDGSGSSDADNDALSYAWTFGDGGTSTDAKPAHVYSAAGAFTVTVTVTDTHGASSAATTSATIAVAADHAPPVVTLSGPKEALPGAQVMMSSDATDNIGVTSVTFEINGADPIQILTPPYQRLVTVPEFAAPGTSLTVGVKALDAAGNSSTASASLTIVAEPDTVKPIVTVKVPSQAAPGSVLQVGATASDNTGVATVLLAANGTTFATLTAPPFEAAFVIPAGTAVGSSFVFSAQAIDGSDNRATASANVSIVQAADTTAPTVTITAPPTATAGTGITITATAADDTGVASVGFFLDGTRIATVVDPPYLATLSLLSTLPAGTRLHLEARAADFSGLSGVASQDVNIVAAGAGVVTGEVYDDRTGLPVEGASAMLVGADARGVPYTQTASSDVHGRYLMRATEGAGVVHVTKPGWSVANRSIDVRPDRAVAIVDARITPTAAGAAIAALAGGTVTGDGRFFLRVWQREVSASEDPALGQPAAGGPAVQLSIPPGALASNATLTLTPLSRQSLPGLLPPGWTPLAIVDIGPHGLSFATPAALSSPNALKVAAGTPVVFAQWDEQTRAWRAVASSVLATDKGALSGDVTVTGQYAWVVADVVPAAPPVPAAGELLDGVAAALIPGAASAVVNPQPKILFYKPGVTSDVRGTVTTPNALLPSGTIVRSRIIEAYEFVSHAELHLEPVEQDLVLYQIPGGAAPVMAAGFTVSPSLTFEALSLDNGVITVELRAPEEAVHAMDVIGIDGGRVTGDGGLQLDVRAGGVALTTPIDVRPIPANELGADVPAGFELTGAASISFTGKLTSSATWSMPRPAQATDADTFLVARLQELGGQTRFVLTGIGSLASDRLVSETALAGTDATFEGIRLPGRYVFLRAVNPPAFAAGTVTVEGGVAFAGALISTSTVGIVALSQPTGRYIAAVALGDTIVTALDLQKTDLVSRPVAAAAPRQVLPLDLALAARPPTVTSVTPVNGALNVALRDPVVIRFSSPIDPATATLQSVQLTSAAGIVIGTLALTSNNSVATFRAAEALQPNVAYTLTVTQAIADSFGRSLPSPFAATFTSLDTIAPLPPAAGSISATIPGADGKTTITATQGTAGAHDTVTVKNITKKTLTPVVLDANGGFRAVVQAAPSDKLQLVIKDASGNETVVAMPRFRESNADGTVSEAIGAEGGRLEGPGGVAVDIAAGTFPDGAVVTLKPVNEAEFPVKFSEELKAEFPYSGGIELDFGGATPTRYVDISVPAGPNDKADNQWLVSEVLDIDGQPVLNVIDTAKLIGGEIRTSSPPCPGVTGRGVYGIHKSNRQVGLNYGQMWAEGGGSVVATVEFPIAFSTFAFPFLAFSLDQPRRICLPVLTGNITVVENTVSITVAKDALTPADRSIGVENTTRGRKYLFPRDVFELAFVVGGRVTDKFEIDIMEPGGALQRLTPTQILSITPTPNEPGRMTVRLNEDHIKVPVQEVVIRNLNPAPKPVSSLTGGAAVATATVQNHRHTTGDRVTIAGASEIAYNGTFTVTVVDADKFTYPLAGSPAATATGTITAQGPETTRFTQNAVAVKLPVSGGASDSFLVEAIGADGTRRPLVFDTIASPFGPGNMLARAVSGTIDPTRAEIEAHNANCTPQPQCLVPSGPGAARERVLLRESTPVLAPATPAPPTVHEIPPASIKNGAFNFAFDGDPTHQFAVEVHYEEGRRDDIQIPSFRIVVSNPRTGRVIRTLTGQSPPRGDPLNLGPITGDADRPLLLSGPPRFSNFDPASGLTFTFSEAMDEVSLQDVTIKDAAGRAVAIASVRMAAGNTVATFETAAGLRLDETYTINFDGAKDRGGNLVFPKSIVLSTFKPTRLCPTLTGECEMTSSGVRFTQSRGKPSLTEPNGRLLEPLYDVDFLRKDRTRTPSSLASLGTTATATIRDHGLVTGDKVSVKDANPLQYNGTFAITVLNADQFTFKLDIAPGAPATGPIKITGHRPQTTVYATTSASDQRFRFLTFDLTKPERPIELGGAFGGVTKKRLALLPDLGRGTTPALKFRHPLALNADGTDPCGGAGPALIGDFAVTTSWNPQSSYLTFFDVRDPANPCDIASKLLTATPDHLSDFTRRGTVHAQGFARGVATLQHTTGFAAYVAVGEVGIMTTDIGPNIPERLPGTISGPDARVKEGLYAGDFTDVIAAGDKLVAVRRSPAGTADNQLEVLDPNLGPLAALNLPDRPRRMTYVEGFQVDANGDGFIAPSEIRNLVFVSGESCTPGPPSACTFVIHVVDITDLATPNLVGNIPMPALVLDMDVDAEKKKLFAVGDFPANPGWRVKPGYTNGATGGGAFYLLDISRPTLSGLVDQDADPQKWDDRILWHSRYPDRVDGISIDKDRGLAYVAVTYDSARQGALDVWAIYDLCCDLGVDLTAETKKDQATGERGDLLKREKLALQAGITQGLKAAAACAGNPTASIAILEQGSGACIWRQDSPCDATYQPGISDHDFEVFFPTLPADDADVAAPIKCVIDALNDAFTGSIAVVEGGSRSTMTFDDVTFYPVSMAALTRARLNVHPPTAAGGSDPGGDLGMGRQQLLLKWLLEGEFVTGVDGLVQMDPNPLLSNLKLSVGGDPTGIPLLEGYEWARLMEYNAAKAKLYIRVKGASETTSTFKKFYTKQLHDAGKFGIRAALARMVADALNNTAVLQITRDRYRSNGCRDMKPEISDPAQWQPTKCTSFEQYVASVASRSQLFTPDEKRLIARFFRNKSDIEEIPTEEENFNEARADEFIAKTHQFIKKVATDTFPVYAARVATLEPVQLLLRQQNMAALVGAAGILSPGGIGGKLQKALTQAELSIVPRFFNHGFTGAEGVSAVMYRDVDLAGSGTALKKLAVTLAGGESRHVRHEAGATVILTSEISTLERNLNDISHIAKVNAFVLGKGTPQNPFIDQSTDLGKAHGVVFTIDLPAPAFSDSGKRMKERDRQNNFAGFFYYVLDTTGAVQPTPPAAPPLPLNDPQALAPDPACKDAPTIRLMSQQIVPGAAATVRATLLNTSGQTLTKVSVCSDLAQQCKDLPGSVAPNQLLHVDVPFSPPPNAGVLASRIVVSGLDSQGRSVRLEWTDHLINVPAPFEVKLFDNTPLNAFVNPHPFSRRFVNRDAKGDDVKLFGAVTDGTERAIRVAIEKLKPGLPTEIRIVDGETGKVEQGIGVLESGAVKGSSLTLAAGVVGNLELFYTPPSFFIRPGLDDGRDDTFSKRERGVRLSVSQQGVGTTIITIALRRPPVFLAHGLFGDIHVWKDFQPLVPAGGQLNFVVGDVTQSDARKYETFSGFDGRFDLFYVGRNRLAAGFAQGVEDLKFDIAASLSQYNPGFAIGKIDIVGHSMGGVLSRKMTNEDPQIAAAVRKLITINSPHGGSPVANEIVELRKKAGLLDEGTALPNASFDGKTLKIGAISLQAGELVDFFDKDAGFRGSSRGLPQIDFGSMVKIDWCGAAIQILGSTVYANLFKGGVDDLRVGSPEIIKLFGVTKVPTHYLTTATTQNDLGFSTEVSLLWTALGLLCNLTPDATTVEKTKLLRISAEAVKTVVGLLKTPAAPSKNVQGQLKWNTRQRKHLLDLTESSLKFAQEMFIGEDPKRIFSGENDRVVPVPSQFGQVSGLVGGKNIGDDGTSHVFTRIDHQAAKITKLVTTQQCITQSVTPAGRLQVKIDDLPFRDLNGDTQPDPTCRVIRLLEGDPADTKLFFK